MKRRRSHERGHAPFSSAGSCHGGVGGRPPHSFCKCSTTERCTRAPFFTSSRTRVCDTGRSLLLPKGRGLSEKKKHCNNSRWFKGGGELSKCEASSEPQWIYQLYVRILREKIHLNASLFMTERIQTKRDFAEILQEENGRNVQLSGNFWCQTLIFLVVRASMFNFNKNNHAVPTFHQQVATFHP